MESLFLENAALIQKAVESGPYQGFTPEFDEGLGLFLDTQAANIAPQAHSSTTQHEGPFGILPPPAKKQIAKEVLQGLPLSPLKILEETIEGNPRRVVDNLTFFMVAEVNPLTVTSPEEIEDVVNTIRVLSERLGSIQRGAGIWTFDQKPPVHVQKSKGSLHLVQRTVTGDYSLTSLPITQHDLTKDVEAYKKAIADVYKPSPNPSPKHDTVAHSLIFAQLNQALHQEAGDGKLVLPVIMHPESYSNSFAGGANLYRVLGIDTPALVKTENTWNLVEVKKPEKYYQIVDVKTGEPSENIRL